MGGIELDCHNHRLAAEIDGIDGVTGTNADGLNCRACLFWKIPAATSETLTLRGLSTVPVWRTTWRLLF